MSTVATSREPRNPMEDFLRMDRIPHIWCSGCGIGVVVTSFADALRKSEKNLDKVAVVSGIGCTGRVAGYVKLDSFHSTHGRAIPFATGLKLANPELDVVVFSGDGDLTGIGGNHFIHAARRNRLGDGLNILKYYYENSEIRHGADTRTVDITYQGKITCGKFIDREKPPFLDCMNTHLRKSLGDKYVPYGEKR